MAREAADAMKITADDLIQLGLIDCIIDEGPSQSAHHDFTATKDNILHYIREQLAQLQQQSVDSLINSRQKKLMSHGI